MARLGKSGEHWYAVYVRSRHEKKVFDRFREKRISGLLPLVETWRQWSDRRKKVAEPLFKGYVFVKCCHESDYHEILDTDGVVGFVGINRVPSPISKQEIEWIETLVNEPEVLGSITNVVPRGSRVLIVGGPFRGIEGTLTGYARESRFIVFFESIMQGVEVSIPKEYLRFFR